MIEFFRKSNNPIVEEVVKSCKKRRYNLSNFKAVRKDNKRFCVWCTEVQLHHGNQKYCSDICSRSMMAYFHPQKEEGLGILLHRQEFKCNTCEYDYLPILKDIADRLHGGKSYNRLIDITKEFVWYHFARLKANVEKQYRPEVDHIIPISKGGQSLGLDNHQVLCYSCHKKKTSKDLSK